MGEHASQLPRRVGALTFSGGLKNGRGIVLRVKARMAEVLGFPISQPVSFLKKRLIQWDINNYKLVWSEYSLEPLISVILRITEYSCSAEIVWWLNAQAKVGVD